MKKVRLRFALFLVAFLSGCSSQNTTNEIEKIQAALDYERTEKIAESWLGQLDSTGYDQIASIQIITDNMPSDLVADFIEEKRTLYGNIKNRTFVEYHIWTGKKLITYIPNIDDEALARMNLSRSADGFYDLDPAFFSLIRTTSLFRDHAKKRYMQLLYKTATEKEASVHEALTLWINGGGVWEVVSYNIGQDI